MMGINLRFVHGSAKHTDMKPAEAGAEQHGLTPRSAARHDEEKSRAKERIYFHSLYWDPKISVRSQAQLQRPD